MIRYLRILLLPILLLQLTAQSAPADPETESSSQIIVTVVSLDEGIINGAVKLAKEGSNIIVYGDWQYANPEFVFNNVQPGQYDVKFYEIAEIPIGNPVEINILPGQNINLTLEIPYTIVGLPCDQKLEITLDEYYDRLYQRCPGGLCEAGLDYVSLEYGKCLADKNDLDLKSIDLDKRRKIEEIRIALDRFDHAYWIVRCTGGTGAGHLPNRNLPIREIFISELIEIASDSSYSQEDQEGLKWVQLVLGQIEQIHVKFLYDEDYSDWSFLEIACDELADLSEDVVDITEDFSSPMQIAIAHFLEDNYLIN